MNTKNMRQRNSSRCLTKACSAPQLAIHTLIIAVLYLFPNKSLIFCDGGSNLETDIGNSTNIGNSTDIGNSTETENFTGIENSTSVTSVKLDSDSSEKDVDNSNKTIIISADETKIYDAVKYMDVESMISEGYYYDQTAGKFSLSVDGCINRTYQRDRMALTLDFCLSIF